MKYFIFAIIVPILLLSGCGPTLSNVKVYVNDVQFPSNADKGEIKIIFNANRIITTNTTASVPAGALGGL